ncbi:hypothetical protein BaRGS_00007869 [Batillaria attramentaria]|uniref:Large ribosomal subunit protein mL62 n=1 Tax=Batillaria attramentaria TaxID=370345 RepID=A0ABD0LMZ4_9CAEN
MQRLAVVCRRFSSQLLGSLPGNAVHQPVPAATAPFTSCIIRSKHTNDLTSDVPTPGLQFTGYIPVEDLEISYSRSSGPGGQNVNKVNTKVEVRFHVPSASWLTSDIKSKLTEMQKTRITKDGYLVVTSDRTRKQMLNQADCMDKIRTMVFKAAEKPRGLTEEETELRDKRLAKAKERTLREKRDSSLKKQYRGSPSISSM